MHEINIKTQTTISCCWVLVLTGCRYLSLNFTILRWNSSAGNGSFCPRTSQLLVQCQGVLLRQDVCRHAVSGTSTRRTFLWQASMQTDVFILNQGRRHGCPSHYSQKIFFRLMQIRSLSVSFTKGVGQATFGAWLSSLQNTENKVNFLLPFGIPKGFQLQAAPPPRLFPCVPALNVFWPGDATGLDA